MCGFGSLLHSSDDAVRIKPASCRSWACDTCAPVRKMLCEIEARSGKPTKFVTLTTKPSIGTSPLHRRQIMGSAFPKLMKRIARLHGGVKPEYFVVVEKTKRGEPHFHVLLRCPYINQKLLSRWWDELTGAFVVDIREVKSERQAAKYVSKYLAKAPVKFGNCKRYWSSRGWRLGQGEETAETWRRETWRYVRDDLNEAIRLLSREGWHFDGREHKGGVRVGYRAPWWTPGEAPMPWQYTATGSATATAPPPPKRQAA